MKNFILDSPVDRSRSAILLKLTNFPQNAQRLSLILLSIAAHFISSMF